MQVNLKCHNFRWLLYIPITKEKSLDFTLFIRLVSWDVWIALISLLVTVPLVWKISQYSSDPTENVKITELFEGSLFILLQQGSEFMPTKISSKIVLLSIAVFSLVFVEFYSCDLFASFAVTQFKLPFQDMFQLYQSEYKMGGLNEMWKSYFKVHFDRKSQSERHYYSISTYHSLDRV